MVWNLYEKGKFLEPLKFSNGKTQEDVVKEVLNSIKNGEKIIFYAEIADNDTERIQGLSDREKIAENRGMFFVFENVGNGRAVSSRRIWYHTSMTASQGQKNGKKKSDKKDVPSQKTNKSSNQDLKSDSKPDSKQSPIPHLNSTFPLPWYTVAAAVIIILSVLVTPVGAVALAVVSVFAYLIVRYFGLNNSMKVKSTTEWSSKRSSGKLTIHKDTPLSDMNSSWSPREDEE